MSEGIIIAIITSLVSLFSIIISNFSSNKKLVSDVKLEFARYKASTDEKITELTREVREHNNFAKRMPVVENEIKHVENDIKYIEKTIKDLHRDGH